MPLFTRSRKGRQLFGKPKGKATEGRKSSSLLLATDKKGQKEPTRTIGGGFRTALLHQRGTRKCSQNASDDSTVTTMTYSSHGSDLVDNSSGKSWASAGTRNFHKRSPMVPANHPKLKRQGSDGSKKVENDMPETEQLDQIMAKDRNLPGTWYYSSVHILINKQRIKRNIPALTRRIELDQLSRERAAAMAESGTVQHGDPDDTQFRLYPCRRFGENVASGADIRSIHKDMVENGADLNNMLDRRYTYFGAGTAKGKDGALYMCQIFKG